MLRKLLCYNNKVFMFWLVYVYLKWSKSQSRKIQYLSHLPRSILYPLKIYISVKCFLEFVKSRKEALVSTSRNMHFNRKKLKMITGIDNVPLQ